MGAGHEHGDVKALPESRLLIAFALTGSFMVIEFIGGYLTESLALISYLLLSRSTQVEKQQIYSELMAMLVLKYWLLR